MSIYGTLANSNQLVRGPSQCQRPPPSPIRTPLRVDFEAHAKVGVSVVVVVMGGGGEKPAAPKATDPLPLTFADFFS